MIPSAFTFYKPDSIEKAVSIMKDFGDEARVIAGGHSLIPVMKQRLTDIKHLIDLSAIKELKGININGKSISIGAMTTQVELITNENEVVFSDTKNQQMGNSNIISIYKLEEVPD